MEVYDRYQRILDVHQCQSSSTYEANHVAHTLDTLRCVRFLDRLLNVSIAGPVASLRAFTIEGPTSFSQI